MPGCRDESSKIQLQAIFNSLSKQQNVLTYCQNKKIVPGSGMKFSHINTGEIHPAYWAVSLSGPAQLNINRT